MVAEAAEQAAISKVGNFIRSRQKVRRKKTAGELPLVFVTRLGIGWSIHPVAYCRLGEYGLPQKALLSQLLAPCYYLSGDRKKEVSDKNGS
jgi:hypothetical protein